MTQPIAEIFSQGDELIQGQIVDSNAAWLSRELNQMGFLIRRHSAAGDDLAELILVLTEISQRADVCVCTGGLGPTVDDLTAEAVSQAFGLPLQLDKEALEQIRQFFIDRGRIMADSNKKQALLPSGSARLDNRWGTAPGFYLKANRCWFFFMPGVPSEMQGMFQAYISSFLTQQFVLLAPQRLVFHTTGIGESDLQQKMTSFNWPESIQIGFRAAADEVQLKLFFHSSVAGNELQSWERQVRECLGDVIFAVDYPDDSESSLVGIINILMQKQNFKLAVLETLSRGAIVFKCRDYSWLKQGCFYAEEVLEAELHSNEAQVQNRMRAMAEQLRNQTGADLVLVQLAGASLSEIAALNTAVVLYNGLLTPDGFGFEQQTVAGSFARKQNQAAVKALDLLRRYLQNCAFNTIR